jgi:CDP-diglyceride synthetase
MRELSPWLAQLVAFPLGIAAAVLLAVLWCVLTPLRNTISTLSPSSLFHSFLDMSIPSLLLLLLGLVALTVIHELLHAAVHPMAGRSPRTVLGFWPSTLLFYAWYEGERSRNRLITGLLMPLFVLSFLPLVVAVVWQIASGWAALASCFNALASCVDILGAGMLFFQVPCTAIVRNQGWWTYWREAEAVTS